MNLSHCHGRMAIIQPRPLGFNSEAGQRDVCVIPSNLWCSPSVMTSFPPNNASVVQMCATVARWAVWGKKGFLSPLTTTCLGVQDACIPMFTWEMLFSPRATAPCLQMIYTIVKIGLSEYVSANKTHVWASAWKSLQAPPNPTVCLCENKLDVCTLPSAS